MENRKTGGRLLAALLVVLLLSSLFTIIATRPAQAGYVRWVENTGNPVYDPAGTTNRAYYPCVIYDAAKFSGYGGSYYYKMWYGDTGATQWESVAYSDDGINWTNQGTLSGIAAGGYHAKLLFYPGGYSGTGGTYFYRIWYWDSDPLVLYSISAMRTADSADGVNWANDRALTQDATYQLVTGVGTDWNYGTYGPIEVFYNPSAGNIGADPFNYTYAMYYDAATGANEVTALAYSTDGDSWTRYHEAPYANAPIVDHGIAGAWDSGFASAGTVIRESASVWHFWYSGGQGQVGDGIGYASSTDGINWTKSAGNPLLYKNDGVAWRAARTYTPMVIYSPTRFDGHGSDAVFRMWYSGRDIPGSPANFAIGTAERSSIITVGPSGRDFTTIQAAIDGAYDGDTIQVDPGTYHESPRINKELTVVSVSGAASTIIDYGDPYVVQIQSGNVTFDGFTVTNPSYTGGSDASGIVVSEFAATSDVLIANCVIHDIGTMDRSPVTYGTVGINLGQCHDVEVDNCEIYNIGNGYAGDTWAQGISIWGGDAGSQATNIYIHDCDVYNVTSPGSVDSGIGIQGNVSGIVIDNNTITGTGEYGVDTWDIWGGAYSPTIITGNTISGAGVAGVNMVYPGDNLITANTFNGCAIGIFIPGSGDASSLQFNNFSGNTDAIDNESVNLIDASWCYWGDTHGPSYDSVSYGESFSGSLTWEPYLSVPYGGTPPATPIQVATFSPLPAGARGSAYSIDFAASGGTVPYGWFTYKGSLPPGLTLSDAGTLSGTPTAAGDYTFYIEASDAVQADFKIFTLHIEEAYAVIAATAGAGGSITPSGAVSVLVGADQSFTITPDSGYHVSDVLVDGVSVGPVSSYTFTDVTTPHTIGATFAVDTQTVYFAEGYTGAGFQEYLCLGNAGIEPLTVEVTYLFTDGTTLERSYVVPALSRLTVNVNSEVGPDRDVSIKCEADAPFVAERPMYFDYTGAGESWTGGTDAVGASGTSDTWYFAEGYTGAGFDEWVCVLNPGNVEASLTFNFQTQEDGLVVPAGSYTVPAHSRATFKANDLLQGRSYQTSLKLESDQPVVAERPMYFNYQGTAAWGWTGGHDVLGVPSLARGYYFAEGTTRAGFEEWLTLQNPGGEEIIVSAVYNLAVGEPVAREYQVPAGYRSTINVADEVGDGQDVSVYLSSSSDFLAERPMYFDYQGTGSWGWTGGHCVIGAVSAGTTWFFAEGYTGAGFEEWLCIQNPGNQEAVVVITYLPEGGALPVTRSHTVPASSRYTVYVNSDAGEGMSISSMLVSDQPVIVERPMYFNYNGVWTGGSDVVGFMP